MLQHIIYWFAYDTLPFDILINQGMSNIMEFKRLKYKYPENITTLNPLTIKLMERSLFMHADYWLAQGWWLWIQWMCSNPLSFQVVKGRTNWWKSRLISMWHLLGGEVQKIFSWGTLVTAVEFFPSWVESFK